MKKSSKNKELLDIISDVMVNMSFVNKLMLEIVQGINKIHTALEQEEYNIKKPIKDDLVDV